MGEELGIKGQASLGRPLTLPAPSIPGSPQPCDGQDREARRMPACLPNRKCHSHTSQAMEQNVRTSQGAAGSWENPCRWAQQWGLNKCAFGN